MQNLSDSSTPVETNFELLHRLDQQTRVFESMLSAITDFAYIFDREGRFVYANKALLDLWGLTLKDAVGKNFFDLNYPADLAARLQRQIQEVLTSGQRLIDETPYTSPTGAGGYYEYIFSPVAKKEGEVEFVAGTTRDISGRKETERALAEKAAELAKLNRNLEDFTHIVSHDLQSPLGKIISFGDLLKKEAGPVLQEKAGSYLHRIQSSATKASHLLSNLLKYSKATVLKEDVEPVDWNKLLRDVLADFDVPMTGDDAMITSENLPTLKARPVQMHQLLSNLIGNALKYAREKPARIHVSAANDAGLWTFQVKDNGIGMAADDLERVFDLFQRVGSSKKEGSGVGLTICRKIIESHGGRIWVQSVPGQGSIFFFTLLQR